MIKSENLPFALIILDGWGVAPPSRGNAIALAKKPFFDGLVSKYPSFTLQASGESVGLTWAEMGNSEVGHQTIGLGRIIFQSLARINKSIMNRTFFKEPVLLEAEKNVKKNKSSLHLIGLVSDGGVHSHQDHAYALLDFCKYKKIKNVYLHVVLDGRDTMKDAGMEFVNSLETKMKEVGVGKIATVSGRYYAMDRDNHWDRTERAYRAMTEAKAEKKFASALSAIQDSYNNNVYDEMFCPVVINKNEKPVATIKENDSVIFFNFRADRARQLTSAFVLPGFEKFDRKEYLKKLYFATFTQYDKDLPVEVIFRPAQPINSFAEVLSKHKYQQLHAAETEKYAHVTFFFNGGVETPFANEARILVPSPLTPSYDQKPEMSAYELTNKILKEIPKNIYDGIIMNFANADMVGHTGNLNAAIKAVQTIDECLEKIVSAIIAKNGIAIITADHGNAEEMIDFATGEIVKEHTKNPVPFILAGKQWLNASALGDKNVDDFLSGLTPAGMLTDIAPTILHLLKLSIPKEMTGAPLV